MLTREDKDNVLVLLQRCQVTGMQEAQVLLQLAQKLQAEDAEPNAPQETDIPNED